MVKRTGKQEKPGTKAQGAKGKRPAGTPPGNKGGKNPPSKKLSPRAKVKKAQMSVLRKLTRIINGNCNSAAKGNYKCAEFVLDWSGVSEIRTPLVRTKKKSMIAALMKQAEARKKAEAAGQEEAE